MVTTTPALQRIRDLISEMGGHVDVSNLCKLGLMEDADKLVKDRVLGIGYMGKHTVIYDPKTVSKSSMAVMLYNFKKMGEERFKVRKPRDPDMMLVLEAQSDTHELMKEVFKEGSPCAKIIRECLRQTETKLHDWDVIIDELTYPSAGLYQLGAPRNMGIQNGIMDELEDSGVDITETYEYTIQVPARKLAQYFTITVVSLPRDKSLGCLRVDPRFNDLIDAWFIEGCPAVFDVKDES